MKFAPIIRSAFLLGLPFFLEHSASAGWTGQMNGLGQGRTSVNVNSPVAGPKTAEWITPAGTIGQTTVSAAMPPAGYQRDATLPNPLTATIAKSKGSPNYFWQKTLIPGGGDGADNPRIQERVTIVPVECPILDMTTGVVWEDAQEKSGYITVVATASGGVATLLRGFEAFGDGEPDIDLDYYDKTKGKLLWEIMLVGPFEYTESCPFKIYFKIEGDKSKLWFSTDGVALSKEFKITCPENVAVPCGGTTYPVTTEGGCGAVTLSYSINPDQLVPGEPTEVTATAEDAEHNKVQCTFTALRHALVFDGFFSPLDGVGGSCNAALRTIKKGSNIPVKFTTSCDGNLTFAGDQPQFELRKCPNVGLADPLIEKGPFTSVANAWHYNWDTSKLTPNATYKLTAILQDGSRQEVFVKIK
jgi:hypothetical protein